MSSDDGSTVTPGHIIIDVATGRFGTPCEGCRILSAEQLDHMECPNGCLHDLEQCEDCSSENSDHSDR